MAFSVPQTIYVIYFSLILTCTASLLSHDEECLALFEFRQTILYQDYGGFQIFDSWRNKITRNKSDNGFDCCLWDGVTCSNESRVIRLDLSQSNLFGRINSNSTLFNLVHLQMLNLSMNDFDGSQIPPEIARLKQLRSLDLSDSNFNGQIPNEISHLIQLSSLDLSWNPLKLQSPSLEYLLQNLTRIENLHLSKIDIGSSVPRFLANFSFLKSIELENCGLQDELPSAIFHLPKLKLINMAINTNLTGSLPEFHNTTFLEYLDLFKTGFSGRIPGSLSNLTQVTYLNLGENDFTHTLPSLENLSKLVVLYLSDNHFEKGRLLDSLGKLSKLNEVYVSRINIYEEIPSSLANLTELSIVIMAGNSIFGPIPSSFTNLTKLRMINLEKNQLQGPISSSFSNFKSLEFLSLNFNNFSGRVDLDTFVGLSKLESLYLNGNRISFVTTKNYTDGTLPKLEYLGLSSCNLKEFPSFLRFQKKMIGLFLDHNKIGGLVPIWIWNNSQETMKVIELSDNLISGFHHHPSFLPWVGLEVFKFAYNQLRGWLPIPPQTTIIYDVSNNYLIGEIPPLICEVKSLRLLDLSSNNMTGTLPPCLGNLSNLLVLNLKRNNFYGTMMNSFTHGSLLKWIDLSENDFIGQVSKSLTNCTSLQVLSLADNSFEDVFPFWLGTLAELQVLILRSNKFYGAIQGPTSISSQFSKLRIIDLANNSFSGQLPDKYVQIWKAMKSVNVGNSSSMGFKISFNTFMPLEFSYSMMLTNKGVKREYGKIMYILIAIDLSCNNFIGEIPPSLQELHGLELLNLSNNHLTGRILPYFGNLKKLESLDLSQNELSGEIPEELLQLSFLASFNVSFNLLDGRIPQGKQFNTFENSSYLGNSELCGKPLSKDCQSSKASTLLPTSNQYEFLLPSEKIDWIIIFLGVGSGLVVGVVFGNFLNTRYSDWLVKRFTLRKD